MADIDVTQAGDRFHVELRDATGKTTHDVGVPDDYLAELGLTEVDRRELVEKSFEFLLEREPKESIMRTFDLSVIQRYFPEYADEIGRRIAG